MERIEVAVPAELADWLRRYSRALNATLDSVVLKGLEWFKTAVESKGLRARVGEVDVVISDLETADAVRELAELVNNVWHYKRMISGEEHPRAAISAVVTFIDDSVFFRDDSPPPAFRDFDEIRRCTANDRVRNYLIYGDGKLRNGDEVYALLVTKNNKHYKIALVYENKRIRIETAKNGECNVAWYKRLR